MNELRTNRWQLPDGVNELLPEDAWRVESLRRRIMDNCYRWGYELVMPPLIEYLDSLLTGTGETLDLQTFKIIDQHNGRTLGIRADMTPQVARMDAHALRSDFPNRFFYTGSALRARSDGAGSSRTPLQFGAELFGHGESASDAEIIHLMLETVKQAGISEQQLLLDIGHVGVYKALVGTVELMPALEKNLFDALLRGSRPEVDELLASAELPVEFKTAINALTRLSGEPQTVLERAGVAFASSGVAVGHALDNLRAVVDAVRLTHPGVKLHVDLSELRGYRYHTGILFTLYDLAGSQLTRGGRYDAIGEAFGNARAATGFSGDLIQLSLSHQSDVSGLSPARQGIWVAYPMNSELWQQVVKLRSEGERVVMALSEDNAYASHCQCDRMLVQQSGRWVVKELTT